MLPDPHIEKTETEPKILTFPADGSHLTEKQPTAPNPALATDKPDARQVKPYLEPRLAAPLIEINPNTAPFKEWQNHTLTHPAAEHYTPEVTPADPTSWQPAPPRMDAVRYRYLTTPPPLEQPSRSKPKNTSTQWAWWGGPIANNTNSLVRWVLMGAGLVGLALLILWVLSSQPSQSVGVSQDDTVAATATVVAVTSGPTLLPTPAVDLVGANEKWGTVLVNEAMVRTVPLASGNLIQKLKQNTLLAFEKKSSAGWYMLAGGGWIKREDVRVYPDQAVAMTAVAQFQATVAANPLLATPTAAFAENSNPAELSARGALTYQTLNCNIKAEISSSDGIKAYYLPNQAAYNSLSMLPPENHRWFCSEQDATKNGFVRANSPVLPTFAPTATFGVTQRFPTTRPATITTVSGFNGFASTPTPVATP